MFKNFNTEQQRTFSYKRYYLKLNDINLHILKLIKKHNSIKTVLHLIMLK